MSALISAEGSVGAHEWEGVGVGSPAAMLVQDICIATLASQKTKPAALQVQDLLGLWSEFGFGT